MCTIIHITDPSTNVITHAAEVVGVEIISMGIRFHILGGGRCLELQCSHVDAQSILMVTSQLFVTNTRVPLKIPSSSATII